MMKMFPVGTRVMMKAPTETRSSPKARKTRTFLGSLWEESLRPKINRRLKRWQTSGVIDEDSHFVSIYSL